MSITQAMIMSAGLGTRVLPFTAAIPKPLLPIFGIPCLETIVYQLVRGGIKKIVMNVHAHPLQMYGVQQQFEKKYPDIEFLCSDETSFLMGSAGGIKKALRFFQLQEPLLVINADNLCDMDLKGLYQRYQEQKKTCIATLYCTQKKSLEKYSQLILDPTRRILIRIGLKIPGGTVFSGIYLVDPKVFLKLPADKPSELFKDVFEPFMKKRQIGVFLNQSFWEDMGSVQGWQQSHFKLMSFLENPASSYLKTFFLQHNRELSPQVWVSHQVKKWDKEVKVIAPVYLDTSLSILTRQIGPQYVGYGFLLHQTSHGIGWGGIHVGFSESSNL